MGGFGSGKARSRPKAWRGKKLYTTSLPKLEVTKLMRLYLHNPGCSFTFSDIIFRINDSCLFLEDSGNEILTNFSVKIKALSCHFGGLRYFFICPFCHKQTTSMYVCKKSFLACRRCLNMVYPSQNETLSYRLMTKAIKIYNELKQDVWRKPKWMRNKRFKQLRSQYFDYKNLSDLADMFSLKSLYATKHLHKKYGGGIGVPIEIVNSHYGKNWRH